MLELAAVQQNDVVVDLGSGDGRVIVMAAEEFGAKSFGVEADPFRVLWSRGVIRRRGLQDAVKVIWGDMFNHRVSDATVVTVYQGQDINKRLMAKLAAELSPGSRIVSYSFPFDGWTPIMTIDDPRLFLYTV